jgi:hypothetical protein
MKTSLWIVVVLLAGIVGFLVGYSVSSRTGTRSLQKVEAAGEKAAAQPPQAPATPAPLAGAVAEKSAAPSAAYGSASPQKPAAPAAAYGSASPQKPAPAAPPAAPAPKKQSTTGGY